MSLKRFLFLILLVLSAAVLSGCGPYKVTIVLPSGESESAPSVPVAPAQDTAYIDFDGARDIAVTHAAWRAGVAAPEGVWDSQDTTPDGIVGASSIRYSLGPWAVAVSAPVVAPDQRVFTVVVDHLAEIFRWEGSVDAGGRISETAFEVSAPAQQPGELTDETPGSWVGVVVGSPPGAQFDDYFQMLDQDGTRCGIGSLDEAVRDRIAAYRDSGTLLRVYGRLEEAIDAYGRQIVVTHLEEYSSP